MRRRSKIIGRTIRVWMCCLLSYSYFSSAVYSAPSISFNDRLLLILKQNPKLRYLQRFELGSIDWTLGHVETLAVGTHTILSPTGGWSNEDLESLARQRARAQLKKLLEVAQSQLPLINPAAFTQQAKAVILQDTRFETPLHMSDGTIHLQARHPLLVSKQPHQSASQAPTVINSPTGIQPPIVILCEAKGQETPIPIVAPSLTSKNVKVRWFKGSIQASTPLKSFASMQLALKSDRYTPTLSFRFQNKRQANQLKELVRTSKSIELWVMSDSHKGVLP